MIDVVKLSIQAGNGGDGRVSFYRAKFIMKGGPDGGDGGDGGNVYLVGRKNHNTLHLYAGKTGFTAEHGQMGGKRNMIGKKGEDLYLEVPPGTVVWELEPEVVVASPEDAPDDQEVFFRHKDLSVVRLSNIPKKKVAEVLKDGEVVLLCKGGKGGRGNEHFKSSTNTTPMEAEKGTVGEAHEVLLELKLLADVGLVGFPNAGKSTFLSMVTRANPKIANYPFTTIAPNLGVMTLESGREVVIADVPGLIEGASDGKGLGIQFLRHIERCRALMYVLFLEESMVFDEDVSLSKKADIVWEQWRALQHELFAYDEHLRALPYLVTVNKSDLYSSELQAAISKRFAKESIPVVIWSGVTKTGLHDVQQGIEKQTGTQ